MDSRIYAAIDANINRSLEGLRVCEDIFRFVAPNSRISLKLKETRHEIAAQLRILSYSDLLHGRDIKKDSQKYIDLPGEKARESLHDLAKRNLHRAMEAMRSIEEFFKLLHPDADENPFQKIRFSLYSLEKDFLPVLLREDKHNRFYSSLYAILDSYFVADEEYSNTALRLIKGGASIIQLRMKNYPMGKILATAKEISPVCKDNNVLFIVNDYPGIAYLSDADGVHLGQDDMAVSEVRRMLPVNMLIGISAHSGEQAVIAAEQEPDYIAIGPIYDTNTKNNKTIKGIGEEAVRAILNKIDIPVVAIGGLNPERVSILNKMGYNCYAVISYLYSNDKIEENCRKIIKNI